MKNDEIILEMLRIKGINTVQELDAAINKQGKINIGVFVENKAGDKNVKDKI